MRKKILIGAIPVLVGLLVTAASLFYLQNNMSRSGSETVKLPVAADDISPYTEITADDLAMKEIDKDAVNKNAIREPQEIVGNMSTKELQAGWQIPSEAIRKEDVYGNKRVVGVNVDPARLAGARKGDIVDVYWLIPEKNGNWDTSKTKLIAENVRVMKVTGSNGRDIQEVGEKTLTQGNLKPAIAHILVKPEDVQEIIGGSDPENASIAFSRKKEEDSYAEHHAENTEQE